MRTLALFLLLISFCSPLFGRADTVEIPILKINPNISLELYAGGANMNGQTCNQAIAFRGGYRQYFITGRMFRADRAIFENSWMLGYRVRPHRMINLTGSVGFSDVAFIKDRWARPSEEISPSDYRKSYGPCAEMEAEIHFYLNNKPTAWGLAASYYYNVNGIKNLGVFSLGVKWSLLPLQQASFIKETSIQMREKRNRKSAERQLQPVEPPTMPKNVIRTKFLLGMLAGTHVEYERNINYRFGYSVGVGVRYMSEFNLLMMFYESFMGPDAMLRGGEINFGANYYIPTNKGWWSLGVKAAYRHREGSGFYAYSHGSYRRLNRTSDDILGLARISYSWLGKGPLIWDFYMTGGLRHSYSVTNYGNMNSYFNPQNPTSEPYIVKGWNTRLSISIGFDIGFGW